MAILIDTGAVSSAADLIDITNKKIRDEMADIDEALRTLQRSWEGGAFDSCNSKYEYIKSSFSENRFTVINGLVSFLRNQVGEGYEMTEKAVSKAASAFK